MVSRATGVADFILEEFEILAPVSWCEGTVVASSIAEAVCVLSSSRLMLP